MIDTALLFIYSTCSHNTYPKATTEGPSRKLIIRLPCRKDSYGIPITLITATKAGIETNKGCKSANLVFRYNQSAAKYTPATNVIINISDEIIDCIFLQINSFYHVPDDPLAIVAKPPPRSKLTKSSPSPPPIRCPSNETTHP